MITTMFFILVPFLKRAPCIIIHLARNAEKGGGVLMSIILPNLNHSFVPDSGSGSGSGFRFRFRIPDFRVFHTPSSSVIYIIQTEYYDSFSYFICPTTICYTIISTKEQNLIHYSDVALSSKLLNIILHRLFPGINYWAILYFTRGCLNSSLFAILVLPFSF